MSNKMSPGFMINEYMKTHKGEELMLNDVSKLMRQYADQQTAYKDALIAEKNRQLSEGFEDYKQETAGLGEKLAALSEKLERWKDKYEVSVEASKITQTELEAVKKERVEWINEGQKVMLQRDEVTRHRDEAVKLLGDSYFDFNNMPSKWNEKREELLSRISSGETKPVDPESCPICDSPEYYPLSSHKGEKQCMSCGVTSKECQPNEKKVSPWISVEDRLPEQGQTVAFVVDLPGQYRHGQVYGGIFTGSDFATPGYGQPASHWMPLTAPPESLTDKK